MFLKRMNVQYYNYCRTMLLFLVSIEAMYSQGVGNYVLLTEHRSSVEKFRSQLFEYKSSIQKLDDEDEDDLVAWEFHEYVEEIHEIHDEKVFGCLLHKHVYSTDLDKLVDINYEEIDNDDIKHINDVDNLPRAEYVLDNVSGDLSGPLSEFRLLW